MFTSPKNISESRKNKGKNEEQEKKRFFLLYHALAVLLTVVGSTILTN